MDRNTPLSQIIKLLLYTLFFLTPFIFLPWTSELFEFNKMIFVYIISILIAFFWALHLPVYLKLPFTWTPLHPFLLFFYLTQILFTFFISIDPHTSIWGYYSRFNGGVASLSAYLLLYSAFTTFILPNPKNLISTTTIFHPLLYTIILSGTLVSVYGIAQHFGIDADKWKQDVMNRVFSTLGQPNWLAAYITVILPLTWYFTVRPFIVPNAQITFKWKRYFKPKRLFIYIATAALYVCLLYTRSRSGYIAFLISFVFFWAALWISRLNKLSASVNKIKATIIPFGILIGIYVLLSITSSTPFTPSLESYIQNQKSDAQTNDSLSDTTIPEGGTESGEIRKIVWQGAWELGKKYPLTGTGVETFAYSYYWTRPREHNDVSEWDFLYNKAHNEYLNYWATTGAIGTGAYLLFIGVVVFLWIKNFRATPGLPNPLRTQLVALGAGWISILITNFFGFSVVLINVLFYTFPGLMLIGKPTYSRKQIKIPAIPLLREISAISVTVLFVIACFQIFKIFNADLNYSAARKLHRQNELIDAKLYIDKALGNRPFEPVYSNYASAINTDIAVHAFFNNEASLAAVFKENAIYHSNNAVLLNPYHLNFWKDRAAMFINLITLDSKHIEDAINSLEYAQELAPTDAKIPYNLALLKARQKKYDESIKLLNHALALKPNYYDALFALSTYYRQQSLDPQTGGIIDKQKHRQAVENLQKYIELTATRDEELQQRLTDWQSESTKAADVAK